MFTQPTLDTQQSFFFSLEDSLARNHPLFILAQKINWALFEEAFAKHYHPTQGRPAKPIRLMTGLLILKHLRNLSDESVVEQWAENNYYQHVCGNTEFTPRAPCEASELVHFRNRVGAEGMELIFKESIRINGDDAKEEHVVADTTVQEKNITFPTDAKLHRKIIAKCLNMAASEDVELRQTYTRTLKKLALDQRFRHHPKNKGKARKADKKVKTLAGRLVRELGRKLPACDAHHETLSFFARVLARQKHDAHKIYSLHERDVQCIAKGKEHKKYEFGNKVSLLKTKTTGVLVGALSFRNPYDGHTLPLVLEQHERLTGVRAKTATCDRAYKGLREIGGTRIQVPRVVAGKKLGRYRRDKLRLDFRRRSAIEPVIGHVKSDHRLGRNFHKGIFGDIVNVLLAAAAFNFKRMLNKWKGLLSFLALVFQRRVASNPAYLWNFAA
jgi:IS5 family transposase